MLITSISVVPALQLEGTKPVFCHRFMFCELCLGWWAHPKRPKGTNQLCFPSPKEQSCPRGALHSPWHPHGDHFWEAVGRAWCCTLAQMNPGSRCSSPLPVPGLGAWRQGFGEAFLSTKCRTGGAGTSSSLPHAAGWKSPFPSRREKRRLAPRGRGAGESLRDESFREKAQSKQPVALA